MLGEVAEVAVFLAAGTGVLALLRTRGAPGRATASLLAIALLAIVLARVGSLLSPELLEWRTLWLVPVLFFVVRPLSVLVGVISARLTGRELAMMGWFGVRGVGSAYYLAYALVHGLPAAFRDDVIGVTLAVIGASVIVHGITVTPFMSRWGEKAAS